MPNLWIPCECEVEEHEVFVEAELIGYRSGSGIHSPKVGDPLPCGRTITEKDMEHLFERLNEWGDRED